MLYIKSPLNIEDKSFEIIDEIIIKTRPEYRFKNAVHEKIIKRAIHTTADFDWLDILKFSPDVIEIIIHALKNKATIYTDTNMVLAGINKIRLNQLDCDYHCYVADEMVRQIAHKKGITRSMAAIEYAANKAVPHTIGPIYIFGNAPTALFRLLELYKNKMIAPSAVIGVPVGFVGASESKDALMTQKNLAWIAAKGRKGGSNVAAAILNAILYTME